MRRSVSHRIESIDLMKGLVMVIMALDHVRFFMHVETLGGDPTNLETTTTGLFLTRFITHFCAPTFVFLAGTSAYFYGRNKTRVQLSRFLWTRGLWLIFVELVIMDFMWTFNPGYDLILFGVIWAIGVSMIVLALLVYLPLKWILSFGFILVFGHNLLDGIAVEGSGPVAWLWAMLHVQHSFVVGGHMFYFVYPLIPWIGVIGLGYGFGHLYAKDFEPSRRRKWLTGIGLAAIGLFMVLRAFNIYGDPEPWTGQDSTVFTLLSFINIFKYPPLLQYLLLTLGPTIFILGQIENFRNAFSDWLQVFGKVPFFFYIIHLFLIHLIALVALALSGGNWQEMIFDMSSFSSPVLEAFGYPLWAVYLVWVAVVLALYPVCKAYMKYKLGNRDKWWLSYL